MKIIDEHQTNEGVNTPPKSSIPTPPPPPKNYTKEGNIYLGAVLALVGILWLGYNFHVISGLAVDIIFSVWMLLIAVGGYLLTLRKTTAGLIVVFIGGLMLLTDTLNFYISFHRIILPVVLVAVGAIIVFSQTKKKK